MSNTKRNWFQVFAKSSKRNSFADKIPPIKKNNDDLMAFKKFLKLDDHLCQVLAAMCSALGKRNNVKQLDLIESLEEQLTINQVNDSIYELTHKGWIQFELDGPYHTNPALVFVHDAEVALKTSNPQYFPHLNSNTTKQEQLELYVKAIQFRAKDFGFKEWLKFFKKIHKSNSKPFMRKLRMNEASIETQSMALYILAIYPLEEEPIELTKMVKLFASDSLEMLKLKKELNNNEHPLYQASILDRYTTMRGEVLIKPNANWLNAFLSGENIESEHSTLPQTLNRIPFQSIMERQLIYNQDTRDNVQQLFEIVEDKHYKTFVNEIKQKRENAGIILLFSGGPGTGKTELAKQLARHSQRDLLLFDVSKQRNMYLGESEKAIQDVFNKYKDIYKKSSLTPILFFNESDSILQSRQSISGNLSQTENAVLTILLNEMENFNGILICTTNRPDAMDEAFNRRFLFHLHIDEPNESIRYELLCQEFPEANQARLQELSERYPFTGANIQTFHQQRIISKITKSNRYELEDELELFFQSLFQKNKYRSPIGFL